MSELSRNETNQAQEGAEGWPVLEELNCLDGPSTWSSVEQKHFDFHPRLNLLAQGDHGSERGHKVWII